MKYNTICAFDPGVTTGFVALEVVPELRFKKWTEFTGVADFAAMLQNKYMTEPDHRNVFVAEKFYLYPNASRKLIWSGMPAAVAFGYVELMARVLGAPMFSQKAADMHRISDDAIRARTGWPGPLPKSEHIKDAMRHAVYFFYNTWPSLVQAPTPTAPAGLIPT